MEVNGYNEQSVIILRLRKEKDELHINVFQVLDEIIDSIQYNP